MPICCRPRRPPPMLGKADESSREALARDTPATCMTGGADGGRKGAAVLAEAAGAGAEDGCGAPAAEGAKGGNGEAAAFAKGKPPARGSGASTTVSAAERRVPRALASSSCGLGVARARWRQAGTSTPERSAVWLAKGRWKATWPDRSVRHMRRSERASSAAAATAAGWAVRTATEWSTAAFSSSRGDGSSREVTRPERRIPRKVPPVKCRARAAPSTRAPICAEDSAMQGTASDAR